ncbi:MAG: hypothetical protein U0U69_11790 [Acidimicrobiia bacterium]
MGRASALGLIGHIGSRPGSLSDGGPGIAGSLVHKATKSFRLV